MLISENYDSKLYYFQIKKWTFFAWNRAFFQPYIILLKSNKYLKQQNYFFFKIINMFLFYIIVIMLTLLHNFKTHLFHFFCVFFQ